MKKDSLEEKIAAYTAMAAAYLAAHTDAVHAQVQYTDVTPDAVIHNSFFNLDLNNDGVVDFRLVQDGGHYTDTASYLHSWNRAYLNMLPGNRAVNEVSLNNSCYLGPLPLPFNAIINSNPGFNNHNLLLSATHNENLSGGYSNFFTAGCFIDSADSYIGLKMIKNGNTHYGWARVNVQFANPGQIVLKDYAINQTPDAPIVAGMFLCPPPLAIGIANLTSHSVKLLWTPQSNAIGYRIRYRPTGTSVWHSALVGSNTGFKTINNLLPLTNYEWQIRSICQQTPPVWSVYNPIQVFSTLLRMEDEPESVTVNENELLLYPNPAVNEIHLIAGDGGLYEMKVVNMLGQIVSAENINIVEDQSVTVCTSKLTPGTYEVIVTGDAGNYIARFVKK